MSKSLIEDIVRQAAQNAGINERLYEDAAGNNRWKITPHSLRHSCATDMINNGADIYRVSKYLGHSSVKVTEETYVHESSGLGAEEAHEYAPQ
jgi:integrase/recombinase XerD